jgi:peptide/nickel transport system substrate-binding protein
VPFGAPTELPELPPMTGPEEGSPQGRGGTALRPAGLAVALVALSAVLASCSASTSPNPQAGRPGGGTVVWAEAPGITPNWIFPFMSITNFSVANTEQFQYLMYRPLYWFGSGSQPVLNPALSLAYPPVYEGGNKVVVRLKDYRWSENGEPVDATSVLFWMNLMHSEKANWAAYSPGQIPDNVVSVSVDSPAQLTFTLDHPYNQTWFTYNQLSQITPLPRQWDRTNLGGSPGSGGCSSAAYGTNDVACSAVYDFLSSQATVLASYATSPLWQDVDGPWRLQSFDPSGRAVFVPNPSYSGPVRPRLQRFVEQPFASDAAEYSALVHREVDVGNLPIQYLAVPTDNPTVAAANNPRLASHYTLDPLYTWSVNYFPYNFHSTGDGGAAGAIFSQLYFRQAFQSLVDQPDLITRIYRGYAIPTYGPVPLYPSSSYVSKAERTNPYPYSPAHAVDLLRSHGWEVVPNGVSTCIRPGTGPDQCGPGVPMGAKLQFSLQYANDSAAAAPLMDAEKAAWAQAGIEVSLSPASFDAVVQAATPCPSGCPWELENWGVGWFYAPGYYPTGEDIFASGASSNAGGFADPTNDANIKATLQTQADLGQYQDYLARQLPVVWQPNGVTQLTEIKDGLEGVTPQNVFWALTPEAWHFASQ